MKKFELNNINIEFKNRLEERNFYHFVSKRYFVFNSTCENFATTLLEGMACRMPIVCSNLEPMKV